MGESIFEGTITKWLKKPGDKVERDEPLFEISTDKVDAEIPSPSAGVLKEIKIGEGQTVPIQTVVAVIDAAGAAAAGVRWAGTLVWSGTAGRVPALVSTACCTSRSMIRPSGPLPRTAPRSMPCDAARARARGHGKARGERAPRRALRAARYGLT
jgi:2-oxoglutarate dehydrogenase E2 component (dihydrolipoamide succinyltransferase)